jgi:hypothetical protein
MAAPRARAQEGAEPSTQRWARGAAGHLLLPPGRRPASGGLQSGRATAAQQGLRAGLDPLPRVAPSSHGGRPPVPPHRAKARVMQEGRGARLVHQTRAGQHCLRPPVPILALGRRSRCPHSVAERGPWKGGAPAPPRAADPPRGNRGRPGSKPSANERCARTCTHASQAAQCLKVMRTCFLIQAQTLTAHCALLSNACALDTRPWHSFGPKMRRPAQLPQAALVI